jgi:hypothetical protein
VKYFKIYRWDPEVQGQKPYVATYAINMNEWVGGRARWRGTVIATTRAEGELLARGGGSTHLREWRFIKDTCRAAADDELRGSAPPARRGHRPGGEIGEGRTTSEPMSAMFQR